MLNLHVVQAEFGDCFILESSEEKKNTFILVDGSLFQMFEKYLKLSYMNMNVKVPAMNALYNIKITLPLD